MMQVKHFIEECLRKEDERPSAGELLEHPLMQVHRNSKAGNDNTGGALRDLQILVVLRACSGAIVLNFCGWHR